MNMRCFLIVFHLFCMGMCAWFKLHTHRHIHSHTHTHTHTRSLTTHTTFTHHACMYSHVRVHAHTHTHTHTHTHLTHPLTLTRSLTHCFLFAGANRLSQDIRDMTGSGANLFFVACWYVVSPLLIFVSFPSDFTLEFDLLFCMHLLCVLPLFLLLLLLLFKGRSTECT